MDEDGRGRRREIRKMGLGSPFYTLFILFFSFSLVATLTLIRL